MFKMSLLDACALIWFVICWAAYAYYGDYRGRGPKGFVGVSHELRMQWMREVIARENRIVDASLVGNLMSSVSFFASTTMIIIGGIMALLGSADRAIEATSELPFARETSRDLWELKVLLLMALFVYAFFKFTWAIRQFNILSILIGAAPREGARVEDHTQYVEEAGKVNALAGDEFNRGIRAYYFGLAALTWFIQPWLFLCVTTLVVVVLYRRDFSSQALDALRGAASASNADKS